VSWNECNVRLFERVMLLVCMASREGATRCNRSDACNMKHDATTTVDCSHKSYMIILKLQAAVVGAME
jgi:hypothetical protein